MLKAILFDLDNTLLGNSMATFVPAYFQALTRYVAHLIPPDRLLTELLRATRAMEANDGNGPTNEEAFAAPIGIPVYWIADPGETPPSPSFHRGDEMGTLVGQGTLADLWGWVKRR